MFAHELLAGALGQLRSGRLLYFAAVPEDAAPVGRRQGESSVRVANVAGARSASEASSSVAVLRPWSCLGAARDAARDLTDDRAWSMT